jgi:hypothetical protein
MLLRPRQVLYNAIFPVIDTVLQLKAIQREAGIVYLGCSPVFVKRSTADKGYLGCC